MVKFLDLQKQYLSIKDEIDKAIQDSLNNSAFIGGKPVKEFENAFAEFIGVKHCLGVANGTDAMEIALKSLNLPQGSEVIVPANSFIATAEAVSNAGLQVVFCDCDDDYTIDPIALQDCISEKTKVIIPVHLYGRPCDMDAILDIADDYKLFIVEDCAQAHGASYLGKPVGSFGHFACFSFYPGKNLGAYGDGGAILSNDDKLITMARMIANHGRLGKYDHVFEGRNSRLDALQAAILTVKLAHLPEWTKRRRQVAKTYHDELSSLKQITLPPLDEGDVFHLFVIRVKDRDSLKQNLSTQGIQTGIHYPTALVDLPMYKNFFEHKASMFADELLSLPMGDHLSKQEVLKVCRSIKQHYGVSPTKSKIRRT